MQCYLECGAPPIDTLVQPAVPMPFLAGRTRYSAEDRALEYLRRHVAGAWQARGGAISVVSRCEAGSHARLSDAWM